MAFVIDVLHFKKVVKYVIIYMNAKSVKELAIYWTRIKNANVTIVKGMSSIVSKIYVNVNKEHTI